MGTKSESAARVRAGVGREVFTFMGDDGLVEHFDITAVRQKIERGESSAGQSIAWQVVDLSGLIPFLLENVDHCPDRMRELTAADLADPPIFVIRPDGSHTLIDGVHRILRHHSEGRTEIPVFVVPLSYAPQLVLGDRVEVSWGKSLDDMARARAERIKGS